MRARQTIAILIAALFLLLSGSGLWLLLSNKEDWVIIGHIISGLIFLFAVGIHVYYNFKVLKTYIIKQPTIVFTLVLLIFGFYLSSASSHFEQVARRYKNLRYSGKLSKEVVIEQLVLSDSSNISVELRAGKHFWYPQIAIWSEDTLGNYRNSLYVTQSTAKGMFYSGRTRRNFKIYDSNTTTNNITRRVDALPFWSHRRNIQQADGLFSPHPNRPLVDGITGATPDTSVSIKMRTKNKRTPFYLFIEINVAFDDNRFFSEYHYPDDTIYHNGTGMLGQPSIVFKVRVDPNKENHPIFFDYYGHTLPSKGGLIFHDKNGLTTALEIIDWIMVRVNHS